MGNCSPYNCRTPRWSGWFTDLREIRIDLIGHERAKIAKQQDALAASRVAPRIPKVKQRCGVEGSTTELIRPRPPRLDTDLFLRPIASNFP
jgi:hypothetical protein